MWDIIDIYSIHISRLFNSLHNKELIQGLIAQTFTIGRKEISKWYSSNKAMEETRTIKLEHMVGVGECQPRQAAEDEDVADAGQPAVEHE